jgi:hypothetical protein
MPTASGISGKGGSVKIGSTEIPMRNWEVTFADNTVDVSNFTSRNTGGTVAVTQHISGIRKYDITCSGFPDTNLSPLVVIGSTATFNLGITGGASQTTAYPVAVVARITGMDFSLDVNGALTVDITATSLTSA